MIDMKLSNGLKLIANLAIPKSEYNNYETSEILYSSKHKICNIKIKELEVQFQSLLLKIEEIYLSKDIQSYQELFKLLMKYFSEKYIKEFEEKFRICLIMAYFSNTSILSTLPIPISEENIKKKLYKVNPGFDLMDLIPNNKTD